MLEYAHPKIIKRHFLINIQQLNNDFGIADSVTFTKGKGGLPFIQVKNKKASALISIFAGHVLSYHPVNEPEDFLFVSDKAYFEQDKAIRGGIPVCWPWFGPDIENSDNPAHGFARNNFWSLASTNVMQNGDTKIKLDFVDSSETRKKWPHSFYLSLEITIGEALSLNLCTRNTGTDAFFITEALHSYFNVGNAMQVQVLGLEHTEYFDKTDGFTKVCQEDALTFSEETDQVHTDVKHELKIVDPSFNRTINISLSGNKNVVVWNPWIKKTSKMSDLEDDDYKHFICVEIANAGSDRVEIPADSEHSLIASYSSCD